jgi:hypothetical protein
MPDESCGEKAMVKDQETLIDEKKKMEENQPAQEKEKGCSCCCDN